MDYLTWLDLARRQQDGKVAKIVEMMNKTNEMLTDMVVIQGNKQDGHKTTIRKGLPEVVWRQLNKGVKPGKSNTKQISAVAGQLYALGQADCDLVDMSDDPANLRLSENYAFIEAMSQKLAYTNIYGNSEDNPDEFTGLSYYYSDTSAESGENILDAGGTGTDNTSIYLVVWGEQTVHGFVPKGTKAGIQHEDIGKQLVEDEDGGKFRAYVDEYKAFMGMAVRDWRYVVRIPNISVGNLGTASAAKLIDLMSEATEIVPSLDMGRASFYMNRKVRTALRQQIRDKNNVNLSLDDFAGKKVLHFDGIPIRRVDAIVNNEPKVS